MISAIRKTLLICLFISRFQAMNCMLSPAQQSQGLGPYNAVITGVDLQDF